MHGCVRCVAVRGGRTDQVADSEDAVCLRLATGVQIHQDVGAVHDHAHALDAPTDDDGKLLELRRRGLQLILIIQVHVRDRERVEGAGHHAHRRGINNN